MQVNGSECNSIELIVPGSGHIVKGFAVLGGPILTGNITFVGSHCVEEKITVVHAILVYTFTEHLISCSLYCSYAIYIIRICYICLKFVCLLVCYALHGQHSALQG